ncbi:MAG: ABC transporter permease [Candidatus Velthaea sp.]|jgi:osmoprotectant transport system permease protein
MSALHYILTHLEVIGRYTWQHVVLVTVSLVIAIAIALPLGVVAARRPRLGAWIVGTTGVLYTIPSLALLAVLVVTIGLGFTTAVIALVVYAQMILVRSVVTGLHTVDPAMREAARGLGFTPWQSLMRVELPAALPVLIGGVRVAAVTLIALATLGAWIDAGGLGVLLFEGIHTDDADRIIAGALAAALLAILVDLALRAGERVVTEP